MDRIPRPGELYIHFKNKLYQIITVATHTETGEHMVIYQALYGDFKTYARPMDMFLSPVDADKYPEVIQKYRFELYHQEHTIDIRPSQGPPKEQNSNSMSDMAVREDNAKKHNAEKDNAVEDNVDISITKDIVVEEHGIPEFLMDFLDTSSHTKKLEIITSNMKHMNNRIINDMAVSLDCVIDDGSLENRIQDLLLCLKAMCRFEDRRTR